MRVAKLYQDLLNHPDWVEDLHKYAQSITLFYYALLTRLYHQRGCGLREQSQPRLNRIHAPAGEPNR